MSQIESRALHLPSVWLPPGVNVAPSEAKLIPLQMIFLTAIFEWATTTTAAPADVEAQVDGIVSAIRQLVTLGRMKSAEIVQ